MTYDQWSNEALLDKYDQLVEEKIQAEQYLEDLLDSQTMKIVQDLNCITANLQNVTEVLTHRGYEC